MLNANLHSSPTVMLWDPEYIVHGNMRCVQCIEVKHLTHICQCFFIPPQRHKDFYDSLFAVCANAPRSLLHLTRCAIRSSLGGFCHRGVAQLVLPSPIKKYLLLEPEGILYWRDVWTVTCLLSRQHNTNQLLFNMWISEGYVKKWKFQCASTFFAVIFNQPFNVVSYLKGSKFTGQPSLIVRWYWSIMGIFVVDCTKTFC